MMAQETKQVISLLQDYASVILANDTELQYAKKVGMSDLFNFGFIPKIKRITNKDRHKLSKLNVDKYAKEFDKCQDKNPDEEVFIFFQLNKGEEKTGEELDVIEQSQIKSNLATFTFQEKCKDVTLDEFKIHLNKLRKKLQKHKRIMYIILEIESESIEDKILYCLSKKIKNFIIRGGKYAQSVSQSKNEKDKELWDNISNSVVVVGKGNLLISLPLRMRDRVSYIPCVLNFKPHFIFHEKQKSNGADIKALHLGSDWKYYEWSLEQALIGYEDIEISSEDKHYAFSRARALHQANLMLPE